MRRWPVVLLVAALFCAAAAAEEPRPQTAAGPQIRVEPESFDFGHALPGKTLRKEFTLRNTGDRELVIEGVSTSCGCTAAVIGKTKLKPGASSPLSVSFETRRYLGLVERQVLVRSNDPKTPQLQIKVRATVEGAPPQAPPGG